MFGLFDQFRNVLTLDYFDFRRFNNIPVYKPIGHHSDGFVSFEPNAFMNIVEHIWSLMKPDGMVINKNNNIDMNPTSTRYLVADYLKYRLEKHGYAWPNSPPLEVTNNIHIAMRNLADDFEKRYAMEFDDMVHQLHITTEIAYPTFDAVAKELFLDGINWGRVVALFAFGGSIAIQCCDKNIAYLVDSIYDWLSVYVQNHLEQWISSQGGWNGLADFYEKNDQGAWPSLGRICLGAIGVLALGAYLTQKS